MPLIHVTTCAPRPDDAEALLKDLSAELAAQLGKPERYVMAVLDAAVPMTFAGSCEPSCLVTVKSIGALDGDRPAAVTKAMASVLALRLGVSVDRIYVDFQDVPGRLWGWNGSMFG